MPLEFSVLTVGQNTVIAALQHFLRRHGTDDLSEKSFLYGKSVSNQVRQLQVIFYTIDYTV